MEYKLGWKFICERCEQVYVVDTALDSKEPWARYEITLEYDHMGSRVPKLCPDCRKSFDRWLKGGSF